MTSLARLSNRVSEPDPDPENAVFWVLPEAGYVLVGLSNTDPDAMENAVNYIARRLPL